MFKTLLSQDIAAVKQYIHRLYAALCTPRAPARCASAARLSLRGPSRMSLLAQLEATNALSTPSVFGMLHSLNPCRPIAAAICST